ncbi:hypothetical protein [Methanopyrus sp.]
MTTEPERTEEAISDLLDRVGEELDPVELSNEVKREIERFAVNFRSRYYKRLRDEGIDVDEYRWVVEAVCRTVERALKDVDWRLGYVAERGVRKVLDELEKHVKLGEE